MSVTKHVEMLLRERIGLDSSTVGSSLIKGGIAVRMAALGLPDPESYKQVLLRSSEEIQALVEEVVVPETWFFRDELPFQFLVDQVCKNWLFDTKRPPCRILSLPCSGGEEPYSIAIALKAAGLAADRYQVDAVDISERALARAKQATYGKNAFRGEDLRFRDQYFELIQGRYHLDPTIKAKVRLIQGNLIDDQLLANERPYHFIFCRNLIIYLTPEARAKASQNLVRLLDQAGFLFLGHTERLESKEVRLTPVGAKGTFAYQRALPTSPAEANPQPNSKPKPRTSPKPNAPGSRFIPGKIQPLAPPRPATAPVPRPTKPSTSLTPPREAASLAREGQAVAPTEASGSAPKSWLAQAAERADQGDYVEASALCERALSESGPSAEAYFLLGMSRQADGDRLAAEAALKKAIYLDSHHDEALLALALIAQRRGEIAVAEGYRRRAERALARKGRS